MSRAVGLIALLIVLLVAALLAKRQISTVRSTSAQLAASQASDPMGRDVRTPEQARRLTEQVQSDLNRQLDEQGKQTRQNLDSQTQ